MSQQRYRITFIVLPADAPSVEVLHVEDGRTSFSVPTGEASYGYVFGTYTARDAVREIRRRFKRLGRAA